MAYIFMMEITDKVMLIIRLPSYLLWHRLPRGAMVTTPLRFRVRFKILCRVIQRLIQHCLLQR